MPSNFLLPCGRALCLTPSLPHPISAISSQAAKVTHQVLRLAYKVAYLLELTDWWTPELHLMGLVLHRTTPRVAGIMRARVESERLRMLESVGYVEPRECCAVTHTWLRLSRHLCRVPVTRFSVLMLAARTW